MIKLQNNILKYKFKNPLLLHQALITKGYSNTNSNGGSLENGLKTVNNEYLEFLGDPVLNLVVKEYLIGKYKKKDIPSLDIEVDLGKINDESQSYFKNDHLKIIAKTININELKHSSRANDEDDSSKENADIIEAIIGAVYIDSNYDFNITRDVVIRLLQIGESSGKSDENIINNTVKNSKEVAISKQNKVAFKIPTEKSNIDKLIKLNIIDVTNTLSQLVKEGSNNNWESIISVKDKLNNSNLVEFKSKKSKKKDSINDVIVKLDKWSTSRLSDYENNLNTPSKKDLEKYVNKDDLSKVESLTFKFESKQSGITTWFFVGKLKLNNQNTNHDFKVSAPKKDKLKSEVKNYIANYIKNIDKPKAKNKKTDDLASKIVAYEKESRPFASLKNKFEKYKIEITDITEKQISKDKVELNVSLLFKNNSETMTKKIESNNRTKALNSLSNQLHLAINNKFKDK
ncbi:ribonuclease III family protein [Mycoplasma sp. CSL10166]|uniref:ribonuclease III family protein n=1 Tax=Mycoplasma sp. CSL10166 TaxID=2813825 RepID=UPI00197B38FA|nr:ribonuclease III family protein [Mycoplasma sp. CSL10166]MBN4084084.1 ribonuclease III family protein [Mycoplasma sp. CSL10166]